jgi:YesN/AraC family two-component response regulator
MKTDYVTTQHLLETEQEQDFMKDTLRFTSSLEETIRRGDFKNYKRLLQDSYVEILAPYTFTDIEIAKLYVAVHANDLTNALSNTGLPSNITENLKKETFMQITKAGRIDDLRQISLNLVNHLEQEYKKYNLKHYSYTIQRAVEYIHTRRFQAVSTSSVAKHLDVEQTHLSKCFHEEVGMTLTDYVHSMKTDMAKTLILRRCYSLMEISDMLGYGSYHYFCKVFKKYQHRLPSQV